jgi:hypothetical protein
MAADPDLLAFIAYWRWQTETCCTLPISSPQFITLPESVSNPNISGLQIITDAPSQGKIAAVKQALDNGTLSGPITFITINGPVTLTASDITALYGYVVRWVQATYEVAASLIIGATASAPTITTKDQIMAAFAAIAVH